MRVGVQELVGTFPFGPTSFQVTLCLATVCAPVQLQGDETINPNLSAVGSPIVRCCWILNAVEVCFGRYGCALDLASADCYCSPAGVACLSTCRMHLFQLKDSLTSHMQGGLQIWRITWLQASRDTTPQLPFLD